MLSYNIWHWINICGNSIISSCYCGFVFLLQSGCNYVISLNKNGAEMEYGCAECFFKLFEGQGGYLSLCHLYRRFCTLYSVFFLLHPYTCANYAIMWDPNLYVLNTMAYFREVKMSRKSKMLHCMVTVLSGNILLNTDIIFMKKKKIQKLHHNLICHIFSVIASNPRAQGRYQIRSHTIESKTIALVILVHIRSNV